MATAAPAPAAETEGAEEPKKKKPIVKILLIVVGAIVLMVGVMFATLFFSGYFEKKAELAAQDKLEELEAAGTVRVPAGHADTATLGAAFGAVTVEKA